MVAANEVKHYTLKDHLNEHGSKRLNFPKDPDKLEYYLNNLNIFIEKLSSEFPKLTTGFTPSVEDINYFRNFLKPEFNQLYDSRDDIRLFLQAIVSGYQVKLGATKSFDDWATELFYS